MKTCTQCGETKLKTEYSKAATCLDGTRSYCKSCHKLRKDAWRAKYRDHHNEKCRKWAAANPERRKTAVQKYLAKPETKKKHAALHRKWRLNNPEKARAQVSSRRKKLRTATPPWVDMKAIEKVYVEAAKQGLTVDHIVPIQHNKVSGLHVPWNLQLLPASENYRKSNAYEEYPACKRERATSFAPI